MLPELSSLVPLSWENIEAVVFDIGGVFAIRHADPVRHGLRRAGIEMPADDGSNYHDAHYRAVRALTDATHAGTTDEYARDFWLNYERGYLGSLGVDAGLIDVAVEAMHTEVHLKEAKPIWRYMLHDNIEAFQRLAKSGMPVAIVTNNDGTAAQQMVDFGICQVGEGPLTNVAAIADSGTLNIAKPDPRIFKPALEALGTKPAYTLYVGDTLHADVVGATRAGMPVVQLDPLDLHAHLPHTRLPGVAEVVASLGR